MRSSVASVRRSRSTVSRWPMIRSRSATSALHMYAPMFVVEVWTLVLPSALSASAGRPLCASVMATNDAHVSSA